MSKFGLPYFAESPTIELCREAISGSREYIEVEKEGTITFNYNYCIDGTFPDPECAPTKNLALLHQVRRECRGIIFDKNSGKILSRRFHKFFNVNESDKIGEDAIDLTKPHCLLEKVDGYLVSQIRIEGKIRWATKNGITDLSKSIEDRIQPIENVKYSNFFEHWEKKGYSCLYEWCTKSKHIIVVHEKDQIILTAIRNNTTGKYLDYKTLSRSAQEFNIPIIKCYENYTSKFTSIDALIGDIRVKSDIEGFVIVFESGEMYKLKTDWYSIRSTMINDIINDKKKALISVLFHTTDDLKALLSPEQVDLLTSDYKEIWPILTQCAVALEHDISLLVNYTQGKRQDICGYLKKNISPEWRSIYWQAINREDSVLNILRNKCILYVSSSVKMKNLMGFMRDYLSKYRFENFLKVQ